MICPDCKLEMEDMRDREDRIDWWCENCKKSFAGRASMDDIKKYIRFKISLAQIQLNELKDFVEKL